jgi:hypothetical protein
MLAYITGTVDQELLLRNEYLAAENRILKAQIKGRLLLSEADKATLAEICASSQSKTHQEQCILKSSLISGPNFSVALNGQTRGTPSYPAE